MAIDWQEFRARFPVCERLAYLNTGWSGPSSRDVVQAIAERAEREAYDGPTTLEVRHEKALIVREARAWLAGLIGAGDVALLGSTTEGLNLVLRGLGLTESDRILTSNLEHSSVMVPLYELRRQTGVHVDIARSSAQEAQDEIADLFERSITPRTRIVMISHLSYNRGTRLPVDRIIRTAHERGALVLLDGAQSAGQIAVDVRGLDVDFYAFPAHKYILGPDGVGALYVKPEHIERLAPYSVAHGASEYYDFEGAYTPRTGTMRKFEMATHSGPLLAGAVAAAALIEQTGIANIETRIRELADRLIAGLQRIEGVRITGPLDPPLRSGLVTFTVRDLDPHETFAALWQLRRIVGRVVNDKRVRLAIAPFNNEEDIDAALDAVEHLAMRGLPAGALSAAQVKEIVAEDDD